MRLVQQAWALEPAGHAVDIPSPAPALVKDRPNIIMPTTTQNRVFVALKLPTPVPQLIKVAQAIIAALTGNPHIPSPNPPLTTLTTALTALVTTEAATKTRATGTVPARNVARTNLLSLLQATKANVQQLADLDLEQAEAIITSAGMGVRKTPSRSKAPFTATPGAVSGTVRLAAKAVAVRASYEWEWSVEELLTTLNQSHPPSTSPVSCQARSPFTRICIASRRRSPRTASSTGRAAAPPLA